MEIVSVIALNNEGEVFPRAPREAQATRPRGSF
jgi:hypothetical protein